MKMQEEGDLDQGKGQGTGTGQKDGLGVGTGNMGRGYPVGYEAGARGRGQRTLIVTGEFASQKLVLLFLFPCREGSKIVRVGFLPSHHHRQPCNKCCRHPRF